MMQSLPDAYRALVIGATGGIGAAFAAAIEADPRCGKLHRWSRKDGLDLRDEASIATAARTLGDNSLHLVVDATGALVIDGAGPEKTLRAIDPAAMAAQFAVNAIGPALLLKHLAPKLARTDRAIFATLSARVGSIGDNRLGGWISYRASKAALNQIVHTAAIEIARARPEALVVALHPGTVATSLSDPFTGDRERLGPADSAGRLLAVLDALPASESGGFFAHDGQRIGW